MGQNFTRSAARCGLDMTYIEGDIFVGSFAIKVSEFMSMCPRLLIGLEGSFARAHLLSK